MPSSELSPVRLEEAVIRALADEMARYAPSHPRALRLLEQLREERERLGRSLREGCR